MTTFNTIIYNKGTSCLFLLNFILWSGGYCRKELSTIVSSCVLVRCPCCKQPARHNEPLVEHRHPRWVDGYRHSDGDLDYFLLVLRIHDILVRIRIRGSMPLTNGSGSGFGSGSFYCHHGPSRCQLKTNFF